jgi:16S rRNA (guanine966-N2)-methyltransferase
MSIKLAGDRYLKSRAGLETRPTSSRVREALFNIWQSRLTDARWLDLCSGSGAIGVEALERGANRVVGVELANSACKIIESNWHKVDPKSERSVLYRGDVVKMLPKIKKAESEFDLIYFDPPYASDLYEPVLNLLGELVSEDGAIAVEHHKKSPMPEVISGFGSKLVRDDYRIYGQTALSFYHLSDRSLDRSPD